MSTFQHPLPVKLFGNFPEFDSEYWSIRKSKDSGMSIEEVALMWKQTVKELQKKKHPSRTKENYYLGQAIKGQMNLII